MGRLYSVTAYDVATGAVVDTFKTLIGLTTADTVGHRGRLRSISIGGAGQAAQDIQASYRLVRKTGHAAVVGTATSVTPAKHDALSLAASLTSFKNYTVEPTNFETVNILEVPLNSRGTLLKEWASGEGPRINRDESLFLQASPGITTAVTLTITMEWEED